ncbi:MAG: hypothetical protein RR806_02610 [Oscillospiraceae bacterium]
MEQQNALKVTTFGGFEKKSVLSYIDEITSKSSSMENSLNEKIKEITLANDELTKQVNDFGIKMSSLERQLKDERNKIGVLTGEIDQLNLNILSQKKTEQELDKELKINIEQNKILSSKLNVAESKANKFDETAIDVGSLLIDAKSAAQKIIDKAMFDVNDIKETTNKNINNISAEVTNFKKDVDNLRCTIDDVVGSISNRLNSLIVSVEQIEKRCQAISSTIDETQKSEKVQVTDEPTEVDEVINKKTDDFILIDKNSEKKLQQPQHFFR